MLYIISPVCWSILHVHLYFYKWFHVSTRSTAQGQTEDEACICSNDAVCWFIVHICSSSVSLSYKLPFIDNKVSQALQQTSMTMLVPQGQALKSSFHGLTGSVQPHEWVTLKRNLNSTTWRFRINSSWWLKTKLQTWQTRIANKSCLECNQDFTERENK